ncbi:hypothetical protein Droror1_Dr00003935 [Drosera rotundifolia]
MTILHMVQGALNWPETREEQLRLVKGGTAAPVMGDTVVAGRGEGRCGCGRERRRKVRWWPKPWAAANSWAVNGRSDPATRSSKTGHPLYPLTSSHNHEFDKVLNFLHAASTPNTFLQNKLKTRQGVCGFHEAEA